MKRILLELLLRLEAIGREHEELFDSEVRDRMGKAIICGYVRALAGYQLPNDFGLFSPAANARVKEALCEFIDAANGESARLGLATFHQRLAAFQDSTVRTPGHEWNDFDEFFGTTNPGSYDEFGNVIDRNLR